MMEPIIGEALNPLTLTTLQKRADLVFFEGPLLSLFENQHGESFLFLWADVDKQLHRWVILRVAPERLAGYLNRRITLRELVVDPNDGYVFVADLSGPSVFDHLWMVLPSALPQSYLPAGDSYYEFSPENIELDLVDLSRHYRTPLLDLHLKSGKGIGFGTADVITLGSVLRSTGELAESIAISLFAGRDRAANADKENARAYGQFQYVTQKAASFSAILRPLMSQENLPGFADKTTEVVDVIVGLLAATPDYEGLKQAAERHQDSVIRHLEALVKDVQTRSVALDVRWASPVTGEIKSAAIDTSSSIKILENINRLEREESEGFWNQGVFLAVDIKLRSYRFQSSAGRESTGKFDPKLAYPLTHISFELEYRVYMNRRTVKVSGRSRPRVAETIGELEPLGTTPELEIGGRTQ